ncbi:MAG: hypothetical protein QOI67_2061 [Gaiellaceae bacterium]|jgi:hypothetical protein|nr:hypothetical protein [Gaiellaceae bacterium]
MTAATADVAAYLAAVRSSLRDLPEAERDDLVAEVEASLVESAGEGGPISARLGPPEEFAAELRSAAGLLETPGVERPPSQLALLVARLRSNWRFEQARSIASELAPIWWVARGYLAVGAIAWIFDTSWSSRYPFVPVVGVGGPGTAEAGLALIVLAVIASVWIGLWARRHGTRFARSVAVVNAALVLAIFPVSLAVTDTGAHDFLVAMAYAPPSQATPGLANDGVPIDNVYPYSRDGKLLHDVLLYDGAGRPIDIAASRVEDPNRRFVVTNGNKPLFNVFPIRYYQPGTKRVERPNAAPYIEHPLVVTPPLPAKRR